jgi:hypothetical protein
MDRRMMPGMPGKARGGSSEPVGSCGFDQTRGGARQRVRRSDPGRVEGREVASGMATLGPARGREAIAQSDCWLRNWQEGQTVGEAPWPSTSWSATWGRGSSQSPIDSGTRSTAPRSWSCTPWASNVARRYTSDSHQRPHFPFSALPFRKSRRPSRHHMMEVGFDECQVARPPSGAGFLGRAIEFDRDMPDIEPGMKGEV